MGIFVSELLGTFILILLGNGVVANVVFKDTKGSNSGWIVITFGWAMAVYIGVLVGNASGAHLNPAVTIVMAMRDQTVMDNIFSYFGGQLLGAFLGACAVYIAYFDHYISNTDADGKLATFSTAPAIRSTISNLLSEAIGTFALLFAILFIPSATTDLGGLAAIPVALIVLSIGLSLGGATGYAINPARDLGPRIAHFLLPIQGKRDSDWSYAWIPIVGPIVGALAANVVYNAVS